MNKHCTNCQAEHSNVTQFCSACFAKVISCAGCNVKFFKEEDYIDYPAQYEYLKKGDHYFCLYCTNTCYKCSEKFGVVGKNFIESNLCEKCTDESNCSVAGCNSKKDFKVIHKEIYCTSHWAQCVKCDDYHYSGDISNEGMCLYCQPKNTGTPDVDVDDEDEDYNDYDSAGPKKIRSNAKRWSKILLSLGYTVIHDPGLKIVHGNEPTQAFALGSFAIEYLDVVKNPNAHKNKQSEKIYQLETKKYNKTIKNILNNKEKLPSHLITNIITNLNYRKLDNENILTLINLDLDNFSINHLPSEKTKFLLQYYLSGRAPKDLLVKIFKYTNLNGVADFIFRNQKLRDRLQEFAEGKLQYLINYIQDPNLLFELVEKYNWHWQANYGVEDNKYKEALLKHKNPALIISKARNLDRFLDVGFWKKIFNKVDEKDLEAEIPKFGYAAFRLADYFPTHILEKMKEMSSGAEDWKEHKRYDIDLALRNRKESKIQSEELKNVFIQITGRLRKPYYGSGDFYQHVNIFQDEFLLQHIDNPNYLVRKHIVQYISPQYLDKLINDKDKLIRAAVAKRIPVEKLPQMMHDSNPYVQAIVAKRIDPKFLREFDTTHHKVKKIIKERLKRAQINSKLTKIAEAHILCRKCSTLLWKGSEIKEKLCSTCASIGANVSSGRKDFEQIQKYVDKPYHYIHFTNNPSLQGLNPKSTFSTPLGIYGYPFNAERLKRVIDDRVEYGGEAPFILVFKAKNPESVLHLGQYTQSDLENDVQKLISLFPDRLKEIVKLFEDSPKKALIKHPGSQLFYITMSL